MATNAHFQGETVWGPKMPVYRIIPEPYLAFHPSRDEDRHKHPLRGLLEYGPFSSGLIGAVWDPIRVAIIAPKGARRAVHDILEEIGSQQRPRERTAYLPEYPGFSSVFGVRLTAADERAQVEISQDIERELNETTRPQDVLASQLSDAVRALRNVRSEFDVVAVYLPARWEPGFYGEPGEDFDLHDYLKAVGAGLNMPLQLIRDDKAVSYHCRASVAWRLAIAFFVKAGGTPWALADASDDVAYLGLSYALRSAAPRFVTCCSQIFDDNGTGLEFIAYDVSGDRIDLDNPFLPRDEMRRVMARSLLLYQRRHGGRTPRRVILHKSTHFTKSEIEGVFDAFEAVADVELVQVQDRTPWSGIRIDEARQQGKKGSPAAFPTLRGTMQPIARKGVLLWTQGNAPDAVGGRNFFKEGKGIPHPVLLRRFSGEGPWDDTARRVLGLSKMNWNNDALYDRLPTTMRYASILANVVKRMPALPPNAHPFRLFM